MSEGMHKTTGKIGQARKYACHAKMQKTKQANKQTIMYNAYSKRMKNAIMQRPKQLHH